MAPAGSEKTSAYTYNGARAMVELHEREMTQFLAVWRDAQRRGVVLPASDDPDYGSFEALLGHVLKAAGSYMQWVCKVLELPDPGIETPPDGAGVASQAETYLTHLFERWRLPLTEVAEERFFRPSHPTRSGIDMCVESMLEHAIVHPMRHRLQLERLGQQTA